MCYRVGPLAGRWASPISDTTDSLNNVDTRPKGLTWGSSVQEFRPSGRKTQPKRLETRYKSLEAYHAVKCTLLYAMRGFSTLLPITLAVCTSLAVGKPTPSRATRDAEEVSARNAARIARGLPLVTPKRLYDPSRVRARAPSATPTSIGSDHSAYLNTCTDISMPGYGTTLQATCLSQPDVLGNQVSQVSTVDIWTCAAPQANYYDPCGVPIKCVPSDDGEFVACSCPNEVIEPVNGQPYNGFVINLNAFIYNDNGSLACTQ